MTKTSKMTHDQIVLSLTPSRIKQIIAPYFGERGCWANGVWHSLAVGSSSVFHQLNDELVLDIVRYVRENDLSSLAEIADSLTKNRASVQKLGVHEAIAIEYAFEHPLIKGTGQYAITKGYLDLVVLAKPTSIGPFSTYREDTRQFVFEVKTTKEMNDMGSVLRQIKEYREYYGHSTQLFSTDSMRISSYDDLRNTVWVLVTPTVTEEVKNFFRDNGIQVHSLDSEQNTLSETKGGGSVSGDKETEAAR